MSHTGLSRPRPLDAVLRRAGATMVHEGGELIASDFGSVAGELAVCQRAVGIADRSELVKLELRGRAEFVEAVVERVTGLRAQQSTALHYGQGWWCPAGPGHVLVVCEPGEGERDIRALAAPGPPRHGSWTDVTHERAALAVVGPRAHMLLGAVGLSDPAPLSWCGEIQLAGSAALVLHEQPMQFLVVVDGEHALTTWQTLLDVGHRFGVGYVGRSALDRYGVGSRMSARQAEHQH